MPGPRRRSMTGSKLRGSTDSVGSSTSSTNIPSDDDTAGVPERLVNNTRSNTAASPLTSQKSTIDKNIDDATIYYKRKETHHIVTHPMDEDGDSTSTSTSSQTITTTTTLTTEESSPTTPTKSRAQSRPSIFRVITLWILWSFILGLSSLGSLVVYIDIHALHSKNRRYFYLALLLGTLFLGSSLYSPEHREPIYPPGPSNYDIGDAQKFADDIVRRVIERLNPTLEGLRTDIDKALKGSGTNKNLDEEINRKVTDIAKQFFDKYKPTDGSTDLTGKIVSLESDLTEKIKQLERDLTRQLKDQITPLSTRIDNLASRQDSQAQEQKQLEKLQKSMDQTMTDIQTFKTSINDIVDKLNKRQEETKTQSEGQIREWIKDAVDELSRSSPSRSGNFNWKDVENMIEERLETFSADKVGLPDYALQSAGASIILSRTSPQYYKPLDGSVLSFFSSFSRKASGAPPSVILQADNSVGNCWAFAGEKGHVTIRLATPVHPQNFSLEHISEAIAYNVTSCPKKFRVWGLRSENDNNPVFLGEYEYKRGRKAVQTFQMTENVGDAFPIVTLDITSNHGNSDYTCVYRFRVHGNPENISTQKK